MGLTHLPQATVRLLGSSQVITSISSVVKELMENSFDAGASNIDVRLEKHGLEKIEVKDDGSGIVAEDCVCMALPHYTSKITDFSDLGKVQSYGFRGEALYSLCSLASVTITTRTAEDEMARSYVFDNTGNVVESKISHALKGTSVVVTGIFKNVPVRRNVMSTGKRVGEELKKVENVVKTLAVIHPRVRVSLAHNKFLIWQKTSVAHLKLSVLQILNHTVTRQLYHLVHIMDQIKFELLIPKKDCDIQIVSIGSVVDTFRLYINKRPIRDKKIEKVFSEIFFSYFGHYMPTNKFPVCFVAITIPPEMLDINLEPNKTKVFIKDQDDILMCLKDQLSLYYCDNSEENQAVENSTNTRKKRKAEESPTKAEHKTLKSPLKSLKSNHVDLLIREPSPCTTSTEPLRQKQSEVNPGFSDDNSDVIDEKSNDKLFGKSAVNELQIFSENTDEIALNLNENNLSSSSSDGSLFEKSSESVTVSVDPGITYDSQSLSSGDSSELNSQRSSDSLGFSLESDSSVLTVSEKDDLDNEISLSQWSRGNVALNEKKVVGSSVLINPSSVRNGQNKNLSDDCYQNNLVNNTEDASSKHSENLLGELDQFFQSEEGNLLLERVTRNDELQNSNENSDCIPEKNILLPKKPMDQNVLFNVKKTEERNCDDGSLNRSVSSQMGKKELSAFTKFAREMRSEILKESPGMSFTLVASTLASKWRNLQTAERQKYEKISVEEKVKKKEPVKQLNKTLSPKKHEDIVRPSVRVNVEMKFDLEKYFEHLNLSSYRDNLFDIVGQIESSDLWIYSKALSDDYRTEIGVLSLSRLQEACRFHENMEKVLIPVKNLEQSIRTTESDLGSDLWNILMNLQSSTDERTKTKSVDDERIVKNGFRLSIVEDDGEVVALITDVAMNINFYGVEDLRQTLQMIKNHGKDCSIARSRCLNAIKFIRSETIRQCSLSETLLLQKSEVLELANLWWNECQNYNKCPHGKDVIFPLRNFLS